MTTTAPPKAPPKETWADWQQEFPPPHLAQPTTQITRDELISALIDRGIDVDETALRVWETGGVLPRPERRWDATVKGRRAYYPIWALAIVMMLRELQRDGVPLREMRPRLKQVAPLAIFEAARIEDTLRFRDELLSDIPDILGHALKAIATPQWVYYVMIGFFPPVREAISAHVRRYNRLLGSNRIRRAEVTYFDADDKDVANPFPVHFTFPDEEDSSTYTKDVD